eukprot:TRINITY_DN2488_c0_g1_i3.p1 TRINITY_DN2488_c0_g1~~TRINITY_DN2488_c0_g1_i3.p1  ORF type:complete len:136 (-),score=10.75 TRINITY_DN2488_c0_g1_i3:11-418(-)
MNVEERPGYYYKQVAKTFGSYVSIFDGTTKYEIGKTLHQSAKPSHEGGYYVYASLEEAIFADIPRKKGGMFIAPRTVLQVLCWGTRIDYDNGKIAFEYLKPVADMGFPTGYLSTCLLYTSPSPRDRQKSRMPSSA